MRVMACGADISAGEVDGGAESHCAAVLMKDSGQIVGYPCSEKLEQSLFLCPKDGEGEVCRFSRREAGIFWIGGGEQSGKLGFRQCVPCQGLVVSAKTLHVNAYRMAVNGASDSLRAMADVEMYVGMSCQRWLSVFADAHLDVVCYAISLGKNLLQQGERQSRLAAAAFRLIPHHNILTP